MNRVKNWPKPKPFFTPSHAARTNAPARKYADDPADHMRAAEPLLLIGYRVEILLRRGREKALVLNESDTGVQVSGMRTE